MSSHLPIHGVFTLVDMEQMLMKVPLAAMTRSENACMTRRVPQTLMSYIFFAVSISKSSVGVMMV